MLSKSFTLKAQDETQAKIFESLYDLLRQMLTGDATLTGCELTIEPRPELTATWIETPTRETTMTAKDFDVQDGIKRGIDFQLGAGQWVSGQLLLDGRKAGMVFVVERDNGGGHLCTVGEGAIRNRPLSPMDRLKRISDIISEARTTNITSRDPLLPTVWEEIAALCVTEEPTGVDE